MGPFPQVGQNSDPSISGGFREFFENIAGGLGDIGVL